MQALMEEVESQLPVIVYWYTVPGITQVGPEIFTWLKSFVLTKKHIERTRIV